MQIGPLSICMFQDIMRFAFKWPACVSFAERTKLKFKGIPHHKLELLPCQIGEMVISVVITVNLVLHISMHIEGISYSSSRYNCLQISICGNVIRKSHYQFLLFVFGFCFRILITDAALKPTNGYQAIQSLLDAAEKQVLILFHVLSHSENVNV